MRRSVVALVLLWMLGRSPLPAQQYPQLRHYLLNRDILALANAGWDEEAIVDTIRAKPNRFETTVEALAALSAQGLSQRIVQVMLLSKVCGASAARPARPASPGGSDGPCVAEPAAGGSHTLPNASGGLPPAVMGAEYRAPIEIRPDTRCPVSDLSLSLAGGAMPRGLHLTMYGLEGIPQETGQFRFEVLGRSICGASPLKLHLLVVGKPVLEAAPDEIAFSCASPQSCPVPRTILVSSSWPGLPYAVEKSDAAWLRVTQARGTTPARGSAITADVVTVAVDASKLAPGKYHGSVRFSARDGANTPAVAVVLVVGSPP